MGQIVRHTLVLQCLIMLLATNALAQMNVENTEASGTGGSAADADTPGAAGPDVNLFFETPEVISRKRLSVNYFPGTQLKLNCKVSPGASFYAWVRGLDVVSRNLALTVSLSEKNAYGIYRCIAAVNGEPGIYKAMEFVVTEMPDNEKEVTVVPVRQNSDQTLRCKSNSADGIYSWFKYDDKSYRFKRINASSERTIVLKYSDLLKSYDEGFTFYKCHPGKEDYSNKYEHFRLKKDAYTETNDGKLSKRYEVTMRPTLVDVASVPIKVTPQSKVSFECHKVEGGAGSVTWSFRNESASSRYRNLSSDTSLDIKAESDSSILSVKDCGVQNVGYYRCTMGPTVRYAFLNMEVIVPTIHEFSKGVYDMSAVAGDVNELECEIPLGGNVKDVVWRVVPPSGSGSSPFDIAINQEKNGFRAIAKSSSDNRLVIISFSDAASINAYRLECRLGDEFDIVTLKHSGSKPVLTMKPTQYPNYFKYTCNVTGLSDIKFYTTKNTSEPPASEALNPHENPESKGPSYIYAATSESDVMHCSGVDKNNKRIFSNPLRIYPTPFDIQLSIDGIVLDPTRPKVKVAGNPTEFICKVNKSSSLDFDAKSVFIDRNGAMWDATLINISSTEFKYVFYNATEKDSGTFTCRYAKGTPNFIKKRSNEAQINWCSTGQFICDGVCKDGRVKCDGKKDCNDGTDELPVLCNECEPNEVPCGKWNNKEPSRKCALKHWLCDGQDDCENGYDESSPVAKSWCINNCMRNTISCHPNSTCCSSENKCILRSYENDKVQDCRSSTDEASSCVLRMLAPTKSAPLFAAEGSQVTMTCLARGMERPTINWRCNWGHLRDPKRMTESIEVTKFNTDNTYSVIGKLTIKNFTKSDECIYNCEAVTKCRRMISLEIDLKVGVGSVCNSSSCGIGGTCANNDCVCKKNVRGAKCDSCKQGYHSLSGEHPDGCVPCYCSGRYFGCEQSGLYFTKTKVDPKQSDIRLMGWGLYGVYEFNSSASMLSVNNPSGATTEIVANPPGGEEEVRDDDSSYVFYTGLSGKRFTSYGGQLSFTVKVNVRLDVALPPRETRFPLFGLKGWRGPTLVYWLPASDTTAEKQFTVSLDEMNLRAIDGSAVTRDDVMTVLGSLHAVFIRIFHFKFQQNVAIYDISLEEATATSGDKQAQVEKCFSCPAPYTGAFCEECGNEAGKIFHKIIAYNNSLVRWKCVPCSIGYTGDDCNRCEEGYADSVPDRADGARPQCKMFSIPTVEPETLDIVRGRTVVLTCKLNRRNDTNGTTWLLQWQTASGERIENSARVFQVRTGLTSRLVIKDLKSTDSGRYRCEAYNRRSKSAFAYTNLTVTARPVKLVALKTELINSTHSGLKCIVSAAEPASMKQFRVTLTRSPFPREGRAQDYETVMARVGSGNFTGSIEYKLDNSQHSGMWSCHVSDIINNYTVSRRVPLFLESELDYSWNLEPSPETVTPRIGETVRLKCKTVYQFVVPVESDKEIVEIPIQWKFTPANFNAKPPPKYPLSVKPVEVYSTTSGSNADLLPSGVSRDGDDLVISPVAIEHWGTFTCFRRKKAVEGPDAGYFSTSEIHMTNERQQDKNITVTPIRMISQNISLNRTEDKELQCANANNSTADGQSCDGFVWWFKPRNNAELKAFTSAPELGMTLMKETGSTLKLRNVSDKNNGVYYCRCRLFSRPGVEFSIAAEFIVSVPVLEDKEPEPKILKRSERFIPMEKQWFNCYDNSSRPQSKIWWELNGEPISEIQKIDSIKSTNLTGISESNITFKMDPNYHQGLYTCNAQNDVAHKTNYINFNYNSTEVTPLSLHFVLDGFYNQFYKNQSSDINETDVIYVTVDHLNELYFDYVQVQCVATGSPEPDSIVIHHDDPTPTADVPNRFFRCFEEFRLIAPNLYQCSAREAYRYARYRWRCIAKRNVDGAMVTYTKNLRFVRVKTDIVTNIEYYGRLYTEKRFTLFLKAGANESLKIVAYNRKNNGSIPFDVTYSCFLENNKVLPGNAEIKGNVLTIRGVQMALDSQYMYCFVSPKDKKLMRTEGVGQRKFKIMVFSVPDLPVIRLTMTDTAYPNKTIVAPQIIDVDNTTSPDFATRKRRKTLTCEFVNFNEEDRGQIYARDSKRYSLETNIRPLTWAHCETCKCTYDDIFLKYNSFNFRSNVVKRESESRIRMTLRTSLLKATGCFGCIAHRQYYNQSGEKVLRLSMAPFKVLWLSKPGYIGGRGVSVYFKVKLLKDGDFSLNCFMSGFPYPKLTLSFHSMAGALQPPRKWTEIYNGPAYSALYAHVYGSRARYLIPRAQFHNDSLGLYRCTGENMFGTEIADRSFEFLDIRPGQVFDP